MTNVEHTNASCILPYSFSLPSDFIGPEVTICAHSSSGNGYFLYEPLFSIFGQSSLTPFSKLLLACSEIHGRHSPTNNGGTRDIHHRASELDNEHLWSNKCTCKHNWINYAMFCWMSTARNWEGGKKWEGHLGMFPRGEGCFSSLTTVAYHLKWGGGSFWKYHSPISEKWVREAHGHVTPSPPSPSSPVPLPMMPMLNRCPSLMGAETVRNKQLQLSQSRVKVSTLYL